MSDAEPGGANASAGTERIDVPFPEESPRRLRISVGPGRLKLAAASTTGAGDDQWVSGTYHDPSNSIPLRLEVDGGMCRIGQHYRVPRSYRLTPAFDLTLGTSQPYALSIEGGANDQFSCDLGALPLTGLEIKVGAGQMRFAVSQPNPAELDLAQISAGAVELTMRDLANLNAREIEIQGGAAKLAFDFAGELRHHCHVKLSTGAAGVELSIPATTAARITSRMSLGSIDVGDGFTTRDGAFLTPAAVVAVVGSDEVPLLTIEATAALGTLKLRMS